jgi:hypothetical protein
VPAHTAQVLGRPLEAFLPQEQDECQSYRNCQLTYSKHHWMNHLVCLLRTVAKPGNLPNLAVPTNVWLHNWTVHAKVRQNKGGWFAIPAHIRLVAAEHETGWLAIPPDVRLVACYIKGHSAHGQLKDPEGKNEDDYHNE